MVLIQRAWHKKLIDSTALVIDGGHAFQAHNEATALVDLSTLEFGNGVVIADGD